MGSMNDYQITPERMRRALREQGASAEEIDRRLREYRVALPSWVPDTLPSGAATVSMDYGTEDKEVAMAITGDGKIQQLIEEGRNIEVGTAIHEKFLAGIE